jgi:cobalt-zinc-cadmium efflux system outer membrane protein
MNRLRFGLAALALAAWLAPARGDEPPLGATLDGLLAYAREHNPELRMRRLEADAAGERVTPAAALPDPQFQLELMDFTNAMAPNRSTSLLPGEVGTTRYRVIQQLPFWGKRGLRGDVAAAEAGQSRALQRQAEAEIDSALRSTYARYYQAAARTRILNDTLSLVDALQRLALTRYSVGLVPQQDVLQAQSEITSLKLDRVDAERGRRAAAARLNALLPRPADAALAEPQALPPVPEALSLRDLTVRMSDTSPELAGEREGLAAADKARELAYRERYPDFGVQLTNNRVNNGINTWDVMFELNIPLQQSARRSREREAESRAEAARARVEAARARLDGHLGESFSAFEASRESGRLLRDTLLPQAEATLKSATAAYETGRVNFSTLIDAERQILRARLSLIDAEVEAGTRLGELGQLVGAKP